MKSFIEVEAGSHFPIQNLPFGAFITEDGEQHLCTRVGDYLVDLYVLDENGYFDGQILGGEFAFLDSTLNYFMSLGHGAWTEARKTLQELLDEENPDLRDDEDIKSQAIISIEGIELMIPVEISNYTDFYSSEEHARNVGRIFRDSDDLMPNWKHIPIGYHGRSSSIILSGKDVHRPSGMIQKGAKPAFKPSEKVDFELEMGFFCGVPTENGESISANDAYDHIFGLVIVNDWSSRDIQKFEYQPLGPFTSKSWATSISPWVVTLEALEPFFCKAQKQVPKPVEYLQSEEPFSIDIKLEVALKTESMEEAETISRTNYKELYWGMEQQLAQQTVTGCNLQTGDLYASGTISGSEPGTFGSMLELSWNAEKPLQLSNGEKRGFLENGDEVIMSAYCESEDLKLGFGELRNRLLD